MKRFTNEPSTSGTATLANEPTEPVDLARCAP